MRSLHARPIASGIYCTVFVSLLTGCNFERDPYQFPTGRPFADDSFWNTTIPEDPALDPDSDRLVKDITAKLQEDAGTDHGVSAGLLEFAVPIYTGDASTDKATVTCTEDWGSCPVEGEVPIPADARPSPGSDGAMVVIERNTGASYEFWRACSGTAVSEPRWQCESPAPEDRQWTTSWGALEKDTVSGTGNSPGSTGANLSRLGGVIRLDEIASGGEINHALSFSSSLICPEVFRWPATKTDGNSSAEPCLPEGTRLQLDPEIDVDSLVIPAAQREIARALQKYGGYVVDQGGARLNLTFEASPEAIASDTVDQVYKDAGLPWDYYHLPGIPWDRLRVLETATGAPASVKSIRAEVADEGVSVTWEPRPSAHKYVVWRKLGPTAKWSSIAEFTSTVTEMVDRPPAGSNPTYEVRAVSRGGTISESTSSATVAIP